MWLGYLLGPHEIVNSLARFRREAREEASVPRQKWRSRMGLSTSIAEEIAQAMERDVQEMGRHRYYERKVLDVWASRIRREWGGK